MKTAIMLVFMMFVSGCATFADKEPAIINEDGYTTTETLELAKNYTTIQVACIKAKTNKTIADLRQEVALLRAQIAPQIQRRTQQQQMQQSLGGAVSGVAPGLDLFLGPATQMLDRAVSLADRALDIQAQRVDNRHQTAMEAISMLKQACDL